MKNRYFFFLGIAIGTLLGVGILSLVERDSLGWFLAGVGLALAGLVYYHARKEDRGLK